MGHKIDTKRLVVKFGGKSLDNGELIRNAARTIASETERGRQIVVVVSAMGEMTDYLIHQVRFASNSGASPEEIDDILSMGERTSARIFTSALHGININARYFDPTDEEWPIITDENFTNANPFKGECSRRVEEFILPLLEKGIVPVIPGFVGRSKRGKITTLGRGGSDATAFILSHALDANETILVTNVDGVMTADPKLIENPRLIGQMTVKELVGLANSGKKFIHGKALRYKDESVPVKITNYTSGRLDNPGTVVKGSFPALEVELVRKEPTAAITFVGRSMMKSPEVLIEITKKIKERGASILGLSADKDSMTAHLGSIDKGLLQSLHKTILNRDEALAMAVREKLAFICVRGVGLEEMPGIIGQIGAPLREHNINIFDMFTITSSIMLFVNWEDRQKTMELIRKSLRE